MQVLEIATAATTLPEARVVTDLLMPYVKKSTVKKAW